MRGDGQGGRGQGGEVRSAGTSEARWARSETIVDAEFRLNERQICHPDDYISIPRRS